MQFLHPPDDGSDSHWISVSDMMTGLMMIFLFIAIIYIQNVSRYFDAVNNATEEICNELLTEFQREQQDWQMTICADGLLITFENDSNFEHNSATLSGEFQSILNKFFPRLMDVIYRYRGDVTELRIEGHTDSSFKRSNDPLSAYLYNTRLSQDRSRNVMDFSLKMHAIRRKQEYLQWALSHVTAHGMSSSRRVYDAQGQEDFAKSRRVEFRLRTRAESQLFGLVAQIADEQ